MYYLKLFNKTIVTFDMDNEIDLRISNINVIENNISLYPTEMLGDINEKTIRDFLASRVIPKNRCNAYEILKTKDLNIRDTKGIIDVCKGLSLNDCYWVVEDENLKFEEYNLYDNDFSETLSLVAFTGYTSKVKGVVTSPEFTTNGYLPKAWRRIENEVYLYKGSTEHWHYANTGNEPYSEYYSSQIAKKMGLNAVEYDLAKWKGILCSTCKLFTSKEYSFIPIANLMRENGIEGAYEIYKENGFEDEFGDMIVFDALIYNPDRHFGNFGLLKNNYTGKIEKVAPIFDNGAGLFSSATNEETKNEETFKKWLASNDDINKSNYGSYYENLVKRFCDLRQVSSLRKLLTFEFDRHEKYNLPEERLNTINSFIKERAIFLINIIRENYNKKNLAISENAVNSEAEDEDEPDM